MHDAVVSKLIAASRGSPCDSMASCFSMITTSKPTQPRHPSVGIDEMSRLLAMVTATAREENGEFCVTVGPVSVTGTVLIGILN